jgi:hypothetical protein
MKSLYKYIKFLGLKKPINLRIITKRNRYYNADYEAEYSDVTGKLIAHNITIYFKDNDRDFETLLAHELIHAWQEENKKHETHGPAFIKYAKRMEKEFNLRDIYIPEIDEE